MEPLVLIQLIIAYALTGAFVFTLGITLLSLVGLAPFVEEKHRDKLFHVLIVQLVIICVTFFGNLLEYNPNNVTKIVREEIGRDLSGSSCYSLGGEWKRVNSNETFEFSQNECIASGKRLSDAAIDHHDFRLAVVGTQGFGYIEREMNGCTTYIGLEFTFISNSEVQTREVINGCGQKADLRSKIIRVTENDA